MAYGDGTKPRKRADGYWVASVEAGWTERGTRKRRSVTAKTEAECKRRLRELRREILSGEAPTTDPRITLKSWIDTWDEILRKRATPNVHTNRMRLVRKWVVPTIGHRRLCDLTVADIRKFEQAMSDGGLAQSSLIGMRSMLTTILKDAKIEGFSVPDPVMLLSKPRSVPNDRVDIPAKDCAKLIRAASTRDMWDTEPHIEPWVPKNECKRMRNGYNTARRTHESRWIAALLQGMRQSECLGLTWDRVDFTQGTITVDRQLVYMRRDISEERLPHQYEHITGRYYFGSPKTASGKRVIPMVPWMEASLRQWQQFCPDSPYGLVWPTASGNPMGHTYDLMAWKALQDVAGVHKGGSGTQDDPWKYYVLHEARHSTATLLMALNVPAVVVISIMGHSSFAMTMNYQHASLSQAREALEGVAGMLQLES